MSTPPEDPSNISNAPKVTPDKSMEGAKVAKPDSSTFKAYQEEAPSAPSQAGSTQMSPMDLAAKAGISTTPSYETLLSQAANARDTLGTVEKNLKTPKLTFKKSQAELLNTKLKNANDHLGAASKVMGANIPDETKVAKSADPITKFVGMVTDGQNKLVQAHDQLQNIKAEKGQLQPGDMLLIQIKLAQAQQEIEYSSVLLSKVVDSIKQVINIQI